MINTFGLTLHRGRARDRADHQVPRRRLDRDPRDDRLLRDHEGHPPPLRQRRRASSPPTRRTRSCRPGCTRSCWSPSCTSRRCGRWPSPRRPGPTCSRRSTSAPTPSRPTRCCGSGTSATSAYRSRCCYSPYREIVRPIVDYATQIRKANPRGVVAVYIPEYVVGPLVGAAAAQPDRAAAQGPAAVHARRDGHLGALPAALLADRPRARGARADPGAGRRPAPRPGRLAGRRPTGPPVTPVSRGTLAHVPTPARARRPRRLAGRRALRGRGRPGRPRRPLRRPRVPDRRPGARPGRLRAARAARASGSSSRSPRAPTATASGAATPSRCSTPRPTG